MGWPVGTRSEYAEVDVARRVGWHLRMLPPICIAAARDTTAPRESHGPVNGPARVVLSLYHHGILVSLTVYNCIPTCTLISVWCLVVPSYNHMDDSFWFLREVRYIQQPRTLACSRLSRPRARRRHRRGADLNLLTVRYLLSAVYYAAVENSRLYRTAYRLLLLLL